MSNIISFKKTENIIIINLIENKRIFFYGSLKQVENLHLIDFFRIDRSVIINMRYILKYKKCFLQTTNYEIYEISRRKQHNFSLIYKEYSKKHTVYHE